MGLVDKLTEFLELRNHRKISLKQCRNCEILSNLLENERRERIRLINSIVLPEKEPEPKTESTEQIPLKTQVPWSVRRHQLELSSREKAEANARIRQERAE